MLGCLAQSVGLLTQEPEVPGLIHTSICPYTDSGRAVVRYWQKYVHEVLVNC